MKWKRNYEREKKGVKLGFPPEPEIQWKFRRDDGAYLSLILSPPYGGQEGVTYELYFYNAGDARTIRLSAYGELEELLKSIGLPEPEDFLSEYNRLADKYGIDPEPFSLWEILDETANITSNKNGGNRTLTSNRSSRIISGFVDFYAARTFSADEKTKLQFYRWLREQGRLES